MSAATMIRPAPGSALRPVDQQREGEVDQEDVDKLLEQQAALHHSFERIATRMDSVASKADSSFVDMNGLMGNEGVKATQARLLESHSSTRRELEITRQQITDLGESLRSEIRSIRDVIAEQAKADREERIAEREAAAREAGAREEAAKRDRRSWLERAAYLLAAVAVIAGGGSMFWWVWMQASRSLGGG